MTCASGLRILAERDGRWGLLTVPSLFEMGLNDCRWVYRFDDGAITVHAIVAADKAVMQWHLTASGAPCRFLIFAHLALGEHEFRHPGIVEIDDGARRISLRPSPDWLWGQTYPQAVHHLAVSLPDIVETMGSGALLFEVQRAALGRRLYSDPHGRNAALLFRHRRLAERSGPCCRSGRSICRRRRRGGAARAALPLQLRQRHRHLDARRGLSRGGQHGPGRGAHHRQGSTGRLWVSYVESQQVKLNHSVCT
ncbi:MAG: hypothetical protein HC850_06590, partial [Rhodomicrobium sp.]|nr:hypothetical protein [Rhodomicrobium sp.]